MASEFEVLSESLEFDLWANTIWINYLSEKGWPEKEREVMLHVLGALDLWLARSTGTFPERMPTPVVSVESLNSLIEGWRQALDQNQDNPEISYKRFNGDELRSSFYQILRHVIDHGTYHRGQLRQMADERGWDDFPETGLMLFYITTGKR